MATSRSTGLQRSDGSQTLGHGPGRKLRPRYKQALRRKWQGTGDAVWLRFTLAGQQAG